MPGGKEWHRARGGGGITGPVPFGKMTNRGGQLVPSRSPRLYFLSVCVPSDASACPLVPEKVNPERAVSFLSWRACRHPESTVPGGLGEGAPPKTEAFSRAGVPG